MESQGIQQGFGLEQFDQCNFLNNKAQVIILEFNVMVFASDRYEKYI